MIHFIVDLYHNSKLTTFTDASEARQSRSASLNRVHYSINWVTDKFEFRKALRTFNDQTVNLHYYSDFSWKTAVSHHSLIVLLSSKLIASQQVSKSTFSTDSSIFTQISEAFSLNSAIKPLTRISQQWSNSEKTFIKSFSAITVGKASLRSITKESETSVNKSIQSIWYLSTVSELLSILLFQTINFWSFTKSNLSLTENNNNMSGSSNLVREADRFNTERA